MIIMSRFSLGHTAPSTCKCKTIVSSLSVEDHHRRRVPETCVACKIKGRAAPGGEGHALDFHPPSSGTVKEKKKEDISLQLWLGKNSPGQFPCKECNEFQSRDCSDLLQHIDIADSDCGIQPEKKKKGGA